jgi:hypothetical protein
LSAARAPLRRTARSAYAHPASTTGSRDASMTTSAALTSPLRGSCVDSDHECWPGELHRVQSQTSYSQPLDRLASASRAMSGRGMDRSDDRIAAARRRSRISRIRATATQRDRPFRPVAGEARSSSVAVIRRHVCCCRADVRSGPRSTAASERRALATIAVQASNSEAVGAALTRPPPHRAGTLYAHGHPTEGASRHRMLRPHHDHTVEQHLHLDHSLGDSFGADRRAR